MPEFDYQGIELFWQNTITLLTARLPAAVAAIAAEKGEPLIAIDSVLGADTSSPPDRWLVVQPDSVDVLESDDSSHVAEENVLDITIALKATDDLEKLTTDLMRYERAVRKVLLSAEVDDLLAGINHTPAHWDLRQGRYRWGQVGQVRVRVLTGLKLVAVYAEIRNG
jgi:hypothetical protein